MNTVGQSPQASEGLGAMSRKYMGSSVHGFLKADGVFEGAQAQVIKDVTAW